MAAQAKHFPAIPRKVHAVEPGLWLERGQQVEPSMLAELAALVLDCGEGAVVSGPTAAAIHGLDGFTLRPPFHVTIPAADSSNARRTHRDGLRPSPRP